MSSQTGVQTLSHFLNFKFTTMKFYRIQVGKRTKNGGFIEQHSFVCKTEIDHLSSVEANYTDRYRGIDVRVTRVIDIESPIIEKIDDTIW